MKDVILTHGNKAEFYDIGRIQYPIEFFDYVYKEVGVTRNSAIADIGSGTGKVTKEFLERGNQVYAIEPDPDMRRIADNNLKIYQNYILINKTAEDNGGGDTCFHEYCDAIHKLFNRYSNQEKLSVNMHLSFIVV